jgi:hypothetical protein
VPGCPVPFGLLTIQPRGEVGAFPAIERIDGPGHVQVVDCPGYRVATLGTELFTVSELAFRGGSSVCDPAEPDHE